MEAVAWLKLAASSRRHAVFGDPGPLARGALRHPDVAVVVDLLASLRAWYLPNMLTPKPSAGPWQRILSAQFAAVESAEQDSIDREVLFLPVSHRSRPTSGRVQRLAESGRLQQRLAAGLARFWQDALHDQWPSLHTVLEHDIAERSAILSTRGAGRMLGGLHSRMHWIDESLTIDTAHDHVLRLNGNGLALAATALNPGPMFQIEEPAQATIYYPAHRFGSNVRRNREGLVGVVGTVRAALLADLSSARCTADLATRHAVAPSTVSYHLSALHRAGLVSRHRDGRHVLYRRTQRADLLIEEA